MHASSSSFTAVSVAVSTEFDPVKFSVNVTEATMSPADALGLANTYSSSNDSASPAETVPAHPLIRYMK